MGEGGREEGVKTDEISKKSFSSGSGNISHFFTIIVHYGLLLSRVDKKWGAG